MKDNRDTFGIPDTLPPLGYGELRGCFWFGGIGFLLLLLGFFHNAIPLVGSAVSGILQKSENQETSRRCGLDLHVSCGWVWRRFYLLGATSRVGLAGGDRRAFSHRGPGGRDCFVD